MTSLSRFAGSKMIKKNFTLLGIVKYKMLLQKNQL